MRTEYIINIITKHASELKEIAAQAGSPNDGGAKHLMEILYAFIAGTEGTVPEKLKEIIDEHEMIESQEYKQYLELDKKYGKYRKGPVAQW